MSVVVFFVCYRGGPGYLQVARLRRCLATSAAKDYVLYRGPVFSARGAGYIGLPSTFTRYFGGYNSFYAIHEYVYYVFGIAPYVGLSIFYGW